MRVVFLDIDGVLHPVPPEGVAWAGSVDLFCWLDILSKLLAPYEDVFVVVHSTWRYSYTPQALGRILDVLGSRYLGVTPPGQGLQAIRWWLSQNRGVTSHCILDDDLREFGEAPPPELITCQPLAGISALDVQAKLRLWLEAT